MKPSLHQNDALPIILIVDDNPALRQVTACILQMSGFCPVEAADGLDALQWMEHAAREQHYPALILLDLAMPGMDGRAFLQWLHATWVGRYPVPAIIVCTASRLDENIAALSPFVKQIVGKPFHAHDLLDVVHRWSLS